MRVTNEVREIDVLYVVVGVNPPSDDQTLAIFGPVSHTSDFEGIAAMYMPGFGWMALVGADEHGLERLRLMVTAMRLQPDYDGRELRIVRFSRAGVEAVP